MKLVVQTLSLCSSLCMSWATPKVVTHIVSTGTASFSPLSFPTQVCAVQVQFGFLIRFPNTMVELMLGRVCQLGNATGIIFVILISPWVNYVTLVRKKAGKSHN